MTQILAVLVTKMARARIRTFRPLGIALTLLMFLTLACSGKGGAGAANQAPTITSFAADRPVITLEESANLSFTFQNGTGTLNQNIGPVNSGGTVAVTPTVDTTYILAVQGGSGSQEQAVTVKVAPLPVAPVVHLPAQVAVNQSGLVATVDEQPGSTYLWTITGGTITAGATSTIVTFTAGPAGAIQLQCTVTNAAGKVSTPGSGTTTAQVSAITGFNATPAVVTASGSTTLNATFSGGTGQVDPGGLPITSGEPLTVHPAGTGTVTYTLTIFNGTTAVTSAQALVAVLPAMANSPISGPAQVAAGLSYQASVPEQEGSTYQWQVGQGTLTAGAGTRTITFTAGAAGANLTLDCTVTNQAGTSVSAPTVTLPIQPAPAPGSLTVSLLQPSVPAGMAGVQAQVNLVPGAVSYQWNLSAGAITAGAGSNVIAFTAGPFGTATVTCTVALSDGSTLTGSAVLQSTQPTINLFQAATPYVTAFTQTDLHFNFSGGTGLLIPGNIPVTSPGFIRAGAGTYTLVVTDQAGNSVPQDCTLTEVPAPVIASFGATHPFIGPGAQTTLQATFTGGSGSVDQNVGLINTAVPVATGALATGTIFTLTVTNPAGDTVAQQTTVRVGSLQLLAGVPSGPGNGDGQGAFARLKAPGGLAVDGTGNFYFADFVDMTIRKVAPDGTVTLLAGTPGVSGTQDGPGRQAQFNVPNGVSVDLAGNVYVSDRENHTIRKIDPAGTVSTVAGVAGTAGFADGTGGTEVTFNQPLGIAVNPAGNRVYVADSANNEVRVFDPTTLPVQTITVAGVRGRTAYADGPIGTSALVEPSGLALAGDNLYIADLGGATVRMLNVATTVVTTVAGVANSPASVDTAPGTQGRFSQPDNLALDAGGNIYVSDLRNSAVRMVPAHTNQILTLAGSTTVAGNADGTTATPGASSTARFNQPDGLAVDGAGNIYVTDRVAGTLRRIPAAAGGTTTTLAGSSARPGSVDGVLAVATFSSPRGMVFDPAGNLFVADGNNNTIRKIDPNGFVSTFAGTTAPIVAPAPAGGIVDGVGPGARFNAPRSIVVDAVGNLYVSDSGSHTIRRIAQDTTVTTVAGTAGTAAFVAGNGLTAQFNRPQGLALDNLGNLYVADSGNHCVRRIDPGLNVTVLAGNPATAGTTDGAAGTGLLMSPYGLVLDGAGNLIVSDSDAHTLRKIALADGTLSTLAGLPGAVATPGFVDGTGAAARFNQPLNLALDSAGNILVADAGNEVVRMVSPAGVVTTAVGIRNMRGVAPGPLPAPFSDPQGLALDASGNYYISTIDAIMKVLLQ
ncbi:MAG: hypothetical protein P4L36_13015 [Holophaga sp.]|nr:hypothetical protein [Holophaga sp.]